MTAAGVGLFSALAVMLGVAVLARAMARRLGLLRPASAGRLRMEVVQRLSLSPKQGLAVVRIGDRLMAVSMGDGGVRPVLELGDAELSALAASAAAAPAAAPLPKLSMEGLVPVLAGGITRGVSLLRRGSRGDAEGAEAAGQAFLLAAEPVHAAAFQAVMEDALAPMIAEQESMSEMEIAAAASIEIETVAVESVETVEQGMEIAAEPVVETSAQVAAAPAEKPAVKARDRRAKPAAAVQATEAVAKPARGRGKAAARRSAETALRAAAGFVLVMLASALAPSAAAAQDVSVPGLTSAVAQAARQEIGALTQTRAALDQGAEAVEARQAPARPRRPVQGTVAAKADSAFAGAPRLDVSVGQGEDGLKLSGTVGVVVMMGLLSLIPGMVLMMTGFTRILIVLHFLRQALGTQTAPPAHLIGAMALLLTGFVMAPTLGEVNRTALQPWMAGEITEAQMLQVGQQPFRQFMLRQTREADVALFVELSGTAAPRTLEQVPLTVLASAFVTSELRTAFQMGFVLFLPFIVIDLVVASVLMSMGMMMLPPAMIALPFKLLLFVLVDGWALVVQGLVTSFR